MFGAGQTIVSGEDFLAVPCDEGETSSMRVREVYRLDRDRGAGREHGGEGEGLRML